MWPKLDYDSWSPTRDTIHRWAQIVGKIRMCKSPWINHSWHTTLYLTARGLTTGVIHNSGHNSWHNSGQNDSRAFSIDFDFIDHVLMINRDDGERASLSLAGQSVASFYGHCMTTLGLFGVKPKFCGHPNEMLDVTPFRGDSEHAAYDADAANRFWHILLSSERVMQKFRSRFIGKVSPVHFFWGGMDLAVTRFSGRRAPEHPGGIPHLPDLVTREAYSHEVSSCGFWPGDARLPMPAFYSYAYPSPPGFDQAKILPKEARFDSTLREFILPYDFVRSSLNPDETLLSFFQSTYEAASTLGNWNRAELEDSPYLKQLQAA